jgi:hypothetical protein
MVRWSSLWTKFSVSQKSSFPQQRLDIAANFPWWRSISDCGALVRTPASTLFRQSSLVSWQLASSSVHFFVVSRNSELLVDSRLSLFSLSSFFGRRLLSVFLS